MYHWDLHLGGASSSAFYTTQKILCVWDRFVFKCFKNHSIAIKSCIGIYTLVGVKGGVGRDRMDILVGLICTATTCTTKILRVSVQSSQDAVISWTARTYKYKRKERYY